MAAIDYEGIRNGLKAIIEAASGTSNARVYIEEEPQFGLMDQPAVAIFLMNRNARDAQQSLSKGTRIRFDLRCELWVMAFHLESYERACVERDRLMANLELALMSDHTIGGKANTSNLQGGEMVSGRNGGDGVFMAASQIILMIDVTATTT